ncbi:MAG: hypothetical protein EOP45_17080, partial [Sphingobacteriaceae bacterium]
MSKEINSILFAPYLQTPIKTLDVPIGGKIYSAQTLPLILDLINICNTISDDFNKKIIDKSTGEVIVKYPNDLTGELTIKYLKKVKKIVSLINSGYVGSLGLHPIVYFYSQEGRHKVASFYATVAFVMKLQETKRFEWFTGLRNRFEEFILKYDYLVQQIVRRYRGAYASYPYIMTFYFDILEELGKDSSNLERIAENIAKLEQHNYLSLLADKEFLASKDFSTEKKSAVYINEALNTALRCKICHARVHRNSISIDHNVRKQDGGIGVPENGQLTHFYCNSGYKEGVLNEHSIGFKTIKSVNRGNYREIQEVKLFEFSSVTFGANANTPFLGFKSQFETPEDIAQQFDKVEKMLKGEITPETTALLSIYLNQLKTTFLDLTIKESVETIDPSEDSQPEVDPIVEEQKDELKSADLIQALRQGYNMSNAHKNTI